MWKGKFFTMLWIHCPGACYVLWIFSSRIEYHQRRRCPKTCYILKLLETFRWILYLMLFIKAFLACQKYSQTQNDQKSNHTEMNPIYLDFSKRKQFFHPHYQLPNWLKKCVREETCDFHYNFCNRNNQHMQLYSYRDGGSRWARFWQNSAALLAQWSRDANKLQHR